MLLHDCQSGAGPRPAAASQAAFAARQRGWEPRAGRGPAPQNHQFGGIRRKLAAFGLLAWALHGQQPGWTIIGWRITAQAGSFGSTLFEAIDKTSAAGVKAIEGHAAQKVSSEIARNFDWNLSDSDVAAVRQKLRSAGMSMPSYYTPEFPPDEAGMRKLFQFAKALAVETIVADPSTGQLESIDKLANEYGVNLALQKGGLKTRMQAIEGRSKRIGLCLTPVDDPTLLKDRASIVRLKATEDSTEFLWALYRSNVKPTALTIEAPQTAAYLQKMTLAVLGDYIDNLSRKTEPRFQIAEADRQQIEAATPAAAQVRPGKPRKLLVVDMQAAYGGHRSLAYANVAIRSMAKKTGAFEPVFNNDFANLRFDKLRQYDALYLNNTVGPIFNAPEVRDSILRYVREGGGLGGHHGTGRASLDWPEFGEMLGAYAGPHAVSNERVTLKVEDRKSPLNKGFAEDSFEWTGEFFRFPTPPYSREKVHVLLSIDVGKTNMKQYTCAGCQRDDNDYAVSWIRRYEKGRVFYTNLGHNPSDFSAPVMLEHFLAGIQYILGDLDADSTPSAVRK